MLENDLSLRRRLAGMWSATSRQHVGKYNALLDPHGTEEVGVTLARLSDELRPASLLLWEEEPVDLILGHIVARELGVPWARATNQDGLVAIVGPVDPGARIVVLADAIRDPRTVDAIKAAVDRAGALVVGFAVLVETPELSKVANGLPLVALARHSGGQP